METLINTHVGGNGLPIRIYKDYAEHDIKNKNSDELFTIKIPIRCVRFCRPNKDSQNDLRCTYRKNGKFTIYYYNPNDPNDSTTIINKWFPGIRYAIVRKEENPYYIDLMNCETLYQNLDYKPV